MRAGRCWVRSKTAARLGATAAQVALAALLAASGGDLPGAVERLHLGVDPLASRRLAPVGLPDL
jgi:hypothetical protein